MVIQRQTRLLIYLIFTELCRCKNILQKCSNILFSSTLFVCVCVVLNLQCGDEQKFFGIYSFLVIYVNNSQIYSESSGISSWVNFELKLLFSVYLLHNHFAYSSDGTLWFMPHIPLGPSRQQSNMSDI